MPRKTEIYKLHEQGLTVKEIAEKTGLIYRSITTMLNRKGISVNKYPILKDTGDLEQFIRGSLLGDGCISKSKEGRGHRMTWGHCLKQECYIQWKYELLNKYNLASEVKLSIQVSDRYLSGSCSTLRLGSLTHPIFSDFRKLYYNKVKFVNREDVINLNELGLAIWYMDDGNIWNRKKRSSCITFNTQSFTKEDVLFLIELLKKKWAIISTYNKSDNTIRVSSKSCQDLVDLIEKYVPECMRYKLKLIKL